MVESSSVAMVGEARLWSEVLRQIVLPPIVERLIIRRMVRQGCAHKSL